MNKINRSSQRTCLTSFGLTRAMVLSFLLAMFFGQSDAVAVGFRVPNQNPEAIARGNAFAATADNPTAIYYNPAGITQLEGDQLYAGMYIISADTEYTSPTTGQKWHTDATPQAVPQLYYVHTCEKAPISYGLGVYAPFGLGLDWEDQPPFSAIAKKGKLLYATVSPVIAWRIIPSLSIAAGPTITYSDVRLQSGGFKFHGDDVGLGAKVGLLWQPHSKWSFGVSYQSASDLEYSGNSEFPGFPGSNASTRAKVPFPQFVVGGISFRPTTNWNFEVDVDWTDWDTLDTVNFNRNSPILPTVPFGFNYTSSFMYEIGATRQLGKGWFVSAGYIYSENSSPDKNYNPLVNDDDLHLGSVGFGHRGQRWDWAFAYHFAYNGSREVTGGGLANGTYETLNHAINLSATYKF